MTRRTSTPRPWLAELYEGKGFTQTGFAAACGVSSCFIAHIVTGIRSPSPQLVSRMADVLGISESEMFMKFYSQKSA